MTYVMPTTLPMRPRIILHFGHMHLELVLSLLDLILFVAREQRPFYQRLLVVLTCQYPLPGRNLCGIGTHIPCDCHTLLCYSVHTLAFGISTKRCLVLVVMRANGSSRPLHAVTEFYRISYNKEIGVVNLFVSISMPRFGLGRPP